MFDAPKDVLRELESVKHSVMVILGLTVAACCAPCDRPIHAKTEPLIERPVVITAVCGDAPQAKTLGDDAVGYLSDVTARIRRELKLYRSLPAPGAVLQFTLPTDGSVSDIRLIRPSGHPDIDLALQRAVAYASPFATLPKQLGSLTVEVTFKTDE